MIECSIEVGWLIALNALFGLAGSAILSLAWTIVRRAGRAEVSLRNLVSLCLALAGGWALALAINGRANLPGTVMAVIVAVLATIAVRTRPGRRTAGLSGWGLTSPDTGGFADTTHMDLGDADKRDH